MNIRPITIEFTGPPNSGKTTLIHGLANELSKLGYSVKVMQEDAELVPVEIPKKTWERNVWYIDTSCRDINSVKNSALNKILDIL